MKRIEVKEFKKLALRLEVKDNSFASTSIGSMTNVYNFCNFCNFSNFSFSTSRILLLIFSNFSNS